MACKRSHDRSTLNSGFVGSASASISCVTERLGKLETAPGKMDARNNLDRSSFARFMSSPSAMVCVRRMIKAATQAAVRAVGAWSLTPLHSTPLQMHSATCFLRKNFPSVFRKHQNLFYDHTKTSLYISVIDLATIRLEAGSTVQLAPSQGHSFVPPWPNPQPACKEHGLRRA